MKFSIQEEGKEKQIFFTFKEATEATGISSPAILNVLKRKNPKFTRRADKKVYFIQGEFDAEPLVKIDDVAFFNMEDLCVEFGISQTVFFNQLFKKEKHFLDGQEISHTITWMREDFQIFIDKMRRIQMFDKLRKGKGRFAVNV